MQALIRRVPQDGSTVDLQPLFFNFTLDASTELLFGESADSQVPGSETGDKDLAEAFDYGLATVKHRMFLGRLMPFHVDAKFQQACKTVRGFADRYVQRATEYRRSLDAHPEKKEAKERYIFLNELAKSTRDPEVLRDETLHILYAGRDTTAGVLANTFHALGRHPQVWKKLRDEVDTLGGVLPDYEAIRNMPYLKGVINEGKPACAPVTMLLQSC